MNVQETPPRKLLAPLHCSNVLLAFSVTGAESELRRSGCCAQGPEVGTRGAAAKGRASGPQLPARPRQQQGHGCGQHPAPEPVAGPCLPGKGEWGRAPSKAKAGVPGSQCLAKCPPTLTQALLCFLNQLEDEDVQTRVAGCLALGCIKVIPANQPLYLPSGLPRPRALGFSICSDGPSSAPPPPVGPRGH